MEVINRMHEALAPVLDRALILYRADQTLVATQNPIRNGEIQEGAPLSREALAGLIRELAGSSGRREILPAHVLYADPARLLWFRGPERRPIFFHTGQKAFDTQLRGARALYPALLFLGVPGNLYVWALASGDRPDELTPVYRAPFLNLYEDGHMCSGTAKLPLDVSTATVPAFERSFFETTFTHSNFRGSLTAHPDGHDGLWRALAEPRRRSVPNEWLLPLAHQKAALTVGDVLNREVRR